MKRQRYLLVATLIAIALLASGCAAPISKGMLKEADESITLDKVRANPKAFEGKSVVWAGVILSTRPHEKGTVIEVLESPADYQKRPKNTDASRGRFLVKANRFLDPAVFCHGRDITVVGRITGTEAALIGDYAYTYPVLALEEYYLWAPEVETPYPPYPRYPFYDPWWWYY